MFSKPLNTDRGFLPAKATAWGQPAPAQPGSRGPPLLSLPLANSPCLSSVPRTHPCQAVEEGSTPGLGRAMHTAGAQEMLVACVVALTGRQFSWTLSRTWEVMWTSWCCSSSNEHLLNINCMHATHHSGKRGYRSKQKTKISVFLELMC